MVSGTTITDPMSGFFLLPRALFEQLASRLTGQGFKILLDLVLASPRKLTIAEIPYEFRSRTAGESKLDALVLVQFAGLLLDKVLRGTVPLRFIAFTLWAPSACLAECAGAPTRRALRARIFPRPKPSARCRSPDANFLLNNQLTYRSQRLKGARAWRGLVLFLAVCSLGSIANIGIARALYAANSSSILAGAAGAVIGVVWNYASVSPRSCGARCR